MLVGVRYNRWNRWVRKALWILAAVGIAASVPLVHNRVLMETSGNAVEFVVDAQDLIVVSQYKADREAFLREWLAAYRDAGVGAAAVYESNLDELDKSGAIRMLTEKEAMLLAGAGGAGAPEASGGTFGNRTFVLFPGEKERGALEPVIREGFARYGIGVEPWSAGGLAGLAIDAGQQEAVLVPLDPNPLLVELLGEYGFRLAVRLSDVAPYDHARLKAMLARLKDAGANMVVFTGKQVTGFEDDEHAMALTGMAELVKENGLVVGVIEQPMAKQQKGIGKLASLTDYRTVRLHSVLEEETFTDAQTLADRFVLAVKDRNIRVIYLNPAARVDRELPRPEHSAHNLLVSLKDPDFGAVERIRALGFELGPPKPFDVVNPGWELPFKLLVIIGAVSLIARMAAYFLPWLALPVFAFGLAATAGLYLLSPTVAMQALALLASVSAPTAAVITGIRDVRRLAERRGRAGGGNGAGDDAVKVAGDGAANGAGNGNGDGALPAGANGAGAGAAYGPWPAFGLGLALFVRTLLLSLVGAVYIVALLNHISYLYVINQFRGVSVLHVLPIFLVALYALFFHRAETFGQVLRNVRRFLLADIKVVWAAAAAVIGAVMLYYLSRTGNEGVVLPIDRAFRSFLENTFGVRPRTKELLTQPLLVMGFYLFLRYREKAGGWMLALAAAGTMGILSPVDTFAHIHSPLAISALRVLYAALLSAGIALVYIAVWEMAAKMAARSWRRWSGSRPLSE